MANWADKAREKRKNRNRIVTLVLIYFMLIGLLAGITFSGHAHEGALKGKLIPIIILSVFTILYWVVFLILMRRTNQRGDK